MTRRSSVYIDVEGFSPKSDYDRRYAPPGTDRALWSLTKLTECLYTLGSQLYGEAGDRVFIHQVGDGFVIVWNFEEATVSRPLALAAGVLQFLLVCADGVGRAGVSEGDFGDVTGCLSKELRDNLHGNQVSLPDGVMTVFPVMGTALTNSVKAQEKPNAPKGPCLFLDPALLEKLPRSGVRLCEASSKLVIVDWINSSWPDLEQVRLTLGLQRFSPDALQEHLVAYIGKCPRPTPDWIENALKMVPAPRP